MSAPRIVTADDICTGVEGTLAAALPGLIKAFGLDQATPPTKPYKAPAKWEHLPTLEAMQAASMPAGAITARGTTGKPRRNGNGSIDATWQVRVAVFDRGRDYWETARRVRTWAALVRTALIHAPTLGGIASGVEWDSETYNQFPQANAARTLGGCVVVVDVFARNVADLGSLDPVAVLSLPSLEVR